MGGLEETLKQITRLSAIRYRELSRKERRKVWSRPKKMKGIKTFPHTGITIIREAFRILP
jgi:hypothetical protein